MATITKGKAAGFHAVQVFTLNSTSIATGIAGTSPANNTTSHSLFLGGATSANWNVREPSVIEFRERDLFAGKMSFGGGDLQPFDIELEEVNATAVAMFNNSSVDQTTNSEFATFSANPQNGTLPNFGVILTQKVQSTEDASSGLIYYINYIIPVCDVRSLFGGPQFQAGTPMRLRITPAMGTKFANGVAFGSNQGWTNNQTDMYMQFTAYPIALTIYVSNGSATTFTTAYRPISTTITAGATPNWFARGGTAQALSSINTSTGVATMSAAGTAGDLNVLIYQTALVKV